MRTSRDEIARRVAELRVAHDSHEPGERYVSLRALAVQDIVAEVFRPDGVGTVGPWVERHVARADVEVFPFGMEYLCLFPVAARAGVCMALKKEPTVAALVGYFQKLLPVQELEKIRVVGAPSGFHVVGRTKAPVSRSMSAAMFVERVGNAVGSERAFGALRMSGACPDKVSGGSERSVCGELLTDARACYEDKFSDVIDAESFMSCVSMPAVIYDFAVRIGYRSVPGHASFGDAVLWLNPRYQFFRLHFVAWLANMMGVSPSVVGTFRKLVAEAGADCAHRGALGVVPVDKHEHVAACEPSCDLERVQVVSSRVPPAPDKHCGCNLISCVHDVGASVGWHNVMPPLAVCEKALDGASVLRRTAAMVASKARDGGHIFTAEECMLNSSKSPAILLAGSMISSEVRGSCGTWPATCLLEPGNASMTIASHQCAGSDNVQLAEAWLPVRLRRWAVRLPRNTKVAVGGKLTVHVPAEGDCYVLCGKGAVDIEILCGAVEFYDIVSFTKKTWYRFLKKRFDFTATAMRTKGFFCSDSQVMVSGLPATCSGVRETDATDDPGDGAYWVGGRIKRMPCDVVRRTEWRDIVVEPEGGTLTVLRAGISVKCVTFLCDPEGCGMEGGLMLAYEGPGRVAGASMRYQYVEDDYALDDGGPSDSDSELYDPRFSPRGYYYDSDNGDDEF